MTEKEKAKAYDEAIERAKKWYNAPNIDKMPTYGNRVIEEIFPELKESEDEKMMHQLHSWMKEFGGAEEYTEKVYTWLKSLLEKQGKETSWKPSKEEMDVLYGLAYITNQYDEYKEEVITRLYQDLKREFFNGLSYENMFHNTEDGVRRRSTIQVLEYARSLDTYNQYGKADIDKNIAWLEKQGKHKDNNKLIWKHWSGCGIAGNGDGTQIYLIKQYNTYSVCSCLSSECDYILLSDLDKLISDGDVDVRYKYLEDILAADDIYQMSMNDTMVEEAKSKATEALSKMSIGKLLGIKNQDEQKPTKWSEEDEKMFRSLHNLIYVVRDCDCDSSEKKELSDWIESLKGRCQSKQDQGWSKEDEKCIRLSTDIIDSALRAGFCVQLDRDRCVDWLKSLRPRNRWKPSDEQMIALSEASGIVGMLTPRGMHLQSLYNDLKKLK